MNDNHRLIKDVSNALNYYVHRTRREEAFDSSAVLTPEYDRTQYRLNKLFGNSKIYDENVPTTKMPKLKSARNSSLTAKVSEDSNEEEDVLKTREKFYYDELIYHLKWNKNNSRKLERSRSSKKHSHFERASSYEKPNKPSTKISDGMEAVRNRMLPTITKREKKDILKITSKILTASEDMLFTPKKIRPSKVCYFKAPQERRRRNQSQNEKSDTRVAGAKEELTAEEREYEKKRLEEFEHEAKLAKEQNDSIEQEEETANYVKNLEEVNGGEKVTYKVVVKTGDRLGSSSEAKISLQIFGEKGKTKLIPLEKSSTHRIPFRKSNTDVFEIECYDLGTINAIQIGHNEQDIEYSWFMDYLKIEDHANNKFYNFTCKDWFSMDSRDKRTTRLLKKENTTTIASVVSSPSSTTSSRSSSCHPSVSITKSPSPSIETPASRATSASKSTKSAESRSSSSSRSSNASRRPQSAAKSPTSVTEKREARKLENKSSSSSATSEDMKSRQSSPDSKDNENVARKQKESTDLGDDRSQYGSQQQLRKSSEIKAIPKNQDKLSAVEAVEKNQLEILKAILTESPTEIDKLNARGESLMCIACEKGFDSIVKYLADNNESLLTTDTPTGFFPVHLCARYNHLNCLKILFDYGATLNVKTNEGQTPLHLAAMYGHLDVVKWLCDQNVDLNILDANELNAYDLACKNKRVRVANHLAELMGKPLLSGSEESTENSGDENEPKEFEDVRSGSTMSRKSTESRAKEEFEEDFIEDKEKDEEEVIKRPKSNRSTNSSRAGTARNEEREEFQDVLKDEEEAVRKESRSSNKSATSSRKSSVSRREEYKADEENIKENEQADEENIKENEQADEENIKENEQADEENIKENEQADDAKINKKSSYSSSLSSSNSSINEQKSINTQQQQQVSSTKNEEREEFQDVLKDEEEAVRKESRSSNKSATSSRKSSVSRREEYKADEKSNNDQTETLAKENISRNASTASLVSRQSTFNKSSLLNDKV